MTPTNSMLEPVRRPKRRRRRNRRRHVVVRPSSDASLLFTGVLCFAAGYFLRSKRDTD